MRWRAKREWGHILIFKQGVKYSMRESMMDLCIYEKLFPTHSDNWYSLRYPLFDMKLPCFTNQQTCRRFGDGMYDSIYDKAEMRLLKYRIST